MKKIILLLLILLNCSTNKRDYFKEWVFIGLLVGDTNSYKESVVFNNLSKLTGPLGQVEYRGTDHPDNTIFNGIGKYNWQEAGDATLYTGKTLGALAWRYKNNPNQETLNQISKHINYFKLMSRLRNGGWGRNFVNIESYNQFLECNKNGTVGSSLANPSCGTMRYIDYSEGGINYKFRYDISIDAIIHSLVGLYWTNKFVPEQRDAIKTLATDLLSFYTTNNWLIKDPNNILLRYGDHTPDTNPVSKINQVILTYLATGNKISLGTWVSLYNIIRTYDGTIVTIEDSNYFNHYMLVKGLFVLKDLDYPVDTGLKNLINEVNNQENKLSEAIDIYTFNAVRIHVKNQSGFPLYDYHCLLDQTFGEVIGLVDRKPYSKWEFSPYRRCIVKSPAELGLNSDFLEAYWLF